MAVGTWGGSGGGAIHRCQPSRSDRESPVFEALSPVHSSLPFFSRFLHRTSRWFFWIWYYSFLISPSVFTQVQLWLFDESSNASFCFAYITIYTTLSFIYFQIRRHRDWFRFSQQVVCKTKHEFVFFVEHYLIALFQYLRNKEQLVYCKRLI